MIVDISSRFRFSYLDCFFPRERRFKIELHRQKRFDFSSKKAVQNVYSHVCPLVEVGCEIDMENMTSDLFFPLLNFCPVSRT